MFTDLPVNPSTGPHDVMYPEPSSLYLHWLGNLSSREGNGHSRSESSRGKLKLVKEVITAVQKTLEKKKGATVSKREEKVLMLGICEIIYVV